MLNHKGLAKDHLGQP